jgi:uncharacterized protein YxeA
MGKFIYSVISIYLTVVISWFILDNNNIDLYGDKMSNREKGNRSERKKQMGR